MCLGYFCFFYFNRCFHSRSSHGHLDYPKVARASWFKMATFKLHDNLQERWDYPIVEPIGFPFLKLIIIIELKISRC